MKVVLLGALLSVLALCAFPLVVGESSEDGTVSFKLAHSSIHIRASSFSAGNGDTSNVNHLRDSAGIVSAFAASHQELEELSDHIFHKTKFSSHGSRAAFSTPSSFSLRSLAAKHEDKQFFVHFSVRSDVRTLAALHKFTGHRVIAHIEGGLYVAIGDEHFAAKARRFPGVSWVQEREPSSKLSGVLQKVLKQSVASVNYRFTEVVAECWYDGCTTAAAVVRHICPDVYVHPTLVEVHCPAHSLQAAVSVLCEHVGVDHVDVKPVLELSNFGGRAIVGTGPEGLRPQESRVLSNISVNNSIIAVVDTGIDMNSCFFFDNSSARPWSNSRVLHSYEVAPCQQCGRCCHAGSGARCTNELNTCGNFIDQSGHGTHVTGTVAGAGPDAVAYGNGIAAGAKIFFQDIENFLDNSQCFAPGRCSSGLSAPTDLLNLFQPAYNAGARVHTNSWGDRLRNSYTLASRAVDDFTSVNPTFIILFCAGNSGQQSDLGSLWAPGTCKNCLTVGASQQSDALFRSMQPFDDDGSFCDPMSRLQFPNINDPCCVNPLSCISRCCEWPSVVNSSLSCCATAPTCASSGGCPVPGNIRSATNVVAFSSRGPTPDGRIKPDLVAPGQDILSAATPTQMNPNSFSFTSPGHCVVPSQTNPRSPFDAFNQALRIMSGTSMSTPLIAGAVEKIRQYFVQGYHPLGIPGTGIRFEPAEALVRAVVLASCTSAFSDSSWGALFTMTDPSIPSPPMFRRPLSANSDPHFFQGFGLPVLDHAVYIAGSTNGYRMHYTNATFFPGSLATAYNIPCDSLQTIPLTFALVWTDPPGNTNGNKQLVNDLDLIVLVPGSTPLQIFGNMHSFADQVNTVERVVIPRCPESGSVTAIVAPGDSLKTSSQAWFLVANGPLQSGFSPIPLPTFFRGRYAGPVTQSQSCLFYPTVRVSVNFKPSSVWSCIVQSSERLDCSVRSQQLALSLAQIVGVAVQGIHVTSTNTKNISMVLSCSAMMNSWGSTESAITLKYVNPLMLFAAIQNMSIATFESENQVLSAFDWSTFALQVSDRPSPSMVMSMSEFADSNCTNMTSTLLPSNPFVFNDAECTRGPSMSGVTYFVRAISCGTLASYSVAADPQTCLPILQVNDVVGRCFPVPDQPSTWLMVNCTPQVLVRSNFSVSLYTSNNCMLVPNSSTVGSVGDCVPFLGITYIQLSSCSAMIQLNMFSDPTCISRLTPPSGVQAPNPFCLPTPAIIPGINSVMIACGSVPPAPMPPPGPSPSPPLPPLPPAPVGPTPPPTPADASAAASTTISPGVIAGSVVGALAFCGLVLAAILQRTRIQAFFRKFRRDKKDAIALDEVKESLLM